MIRNAILALTFAGAMAGAALVGQGSKPADAAYLQPYPDIQRCLQSAWYRLVAPCPPWTYPNYP